MCIIYGREFLINAIKSITITLAGYCVVKTPQLSNWLNIHMTHENDSSSNNTEPERKKSWGGAREGAGRKKGSTNKISAKELLETAEQVIGKPFIVSLLEGYRDTLDDGDRKHRVVYERLILDKVAGQLLDVEVTDSEDSIASKRQAFAEAMAQIAGIKQSD